MFLFDTSHLTLCFLFRHVFLLDDRLPGKAVSLFGGIALDDLHKIVSDFYIKQHLQDLEGQSESCLRHEREVFALQATRERILFCLLVKSHES